MTILAEQSDAVAIWGLAFGALGTLISGLVAVAVAWITYKQAQLGRQVEVIHKATNSLAEEMGKAKMAQGRAEGKAAGLAQGRAEGAGDFRGKPDT